MSVRASLPLLLVLAAALGLAVRAQQAPADPDRVADPLRQAVARVSPSVVRVELESGRPLGDAPRRRLFRPLANRQAGSGLVVGKTRVVTHAALALYEEPRFTVVTASGARFPATLRHLNVAGEVAVLETEEPLDAPAAPSAPSAGLRPGNLVLALGDPFGMAEDAQSAASLGILEGRAPLDAFDVSYRSEVLLTDAAINPGSEGGALVDLDGQVVGLLAPLTQDRRLIDPQDELIGGALSGYALPMEEVRAVLAEAGAPLGFQGRRGGGGLEVVRVEPGGLAERAGLRAGDVIRSANGASVHGGTDLRWARGAAAARRDRGEPGPLRLQVRRGKQSVELILEGAR